VTRAFIISAALLALQVSNQSPKIPQITGARVALVPKTAAGLSVTLENRRSSPLVECAIGITRPGQSAPSDIYSYYFSGAYPGRPDAGPLQPNARRDLELVLRNGTGMERPAMTLAVFADGFVEGTPDQVEAWRTRRREQVDDLAYWVRAFDGLPRIAEPAVRDYVAARMLERAREAPTDPSNVRDRLQRVLELYPSGPDVWIGLDRLRADARRDLAEQPAKPPTANGAQPPEVISDVALTWERSAPTEFVATIENLRDVPIEAFELTLVDRVSNRGLLGQGMDFCLSEPLPAERGSGRIQPHEVREELLGSSPDGAVLRLYYVLFDDLSFEGSSEGRDQLLRRREATAADYAFAIDVIAKASVMPPDEARAFVAEKRAEYVSLPRTKDGMAREAHNLDDYLRQLADDPDRAAAGAKRFQDRLERQRQRLVRHLAR
jgi:hypothetical protein